MLHCGAKVNVYMFSDAHPKALHPLVHMLHFEKSH